MYTLQESPLYQEVCTMDMHHFVLFFSMKAYGQAIDSIFTQIKEVMPTQQTVLVVAVFTSLDSCARFCLLLFKTRPSNLSLAITIS